MRVEGLAQWPQDSGARSGEGGTREVSKHRCAVSTKLFLCDLGLLLGRTLPRALSVVFLAPSRTRHQALFLLKLAHSVMVRGGLQLICLLIPWIKFT